MLLYVTEESFELSMLFYERVVLSFCISGSSTEPVDAEVALYLRTLCKHLQTEAQVISDNLLISS